MVRVFDEKLDAKTFLYTGGDERNVVEGQAADPAGRAGGRSAVPFDVEPVTLPPEAWYPGLKPFVRREELAKRERAIDGRREPAARPKARDAARCRRRSSPRRDRTSMRSKRGSRPTTSRYRGAKGDAEGGRTRPRLAEARHRLDLAVLELTQKPKRRSPPPSRQSSRRDDRRPRSTSRRKRRSMPHARRSTSPPTTYTPLSPIYPKTSTGRRAALAKWITSRDNPLTARVAVNHIWGWHFGRPLVETTDDFGRNGKSPTHPELLDWLAVEFMDNGWKRSRCTG